MKPLALSINISKKAVWRTCACLGAVAVVAFFPAWKTIPSNQHIQVMEVKGNGITGVEIEQAWFDLQVRKEWGTDKALTDATGHVDFPKRRVYGLLHRVVYAWVIDRFDMTCKNCYGPNSFENIKMPKPPDGHKFIKELVTETNATLVYHMKLVVDEDSVSEARVPVSIDYSKALQDAKALIIQGSIGDVDAEYWGEGLKTMSPVRVAVRSGTTIVFSGGGKGFIINPAQPTEVPVFNLWMISGEGHDHFFTFDKVTFKTQAPEDSPLTPPIAAPSENSPRQP